MALRSCWLARRLFGSVMLPPIVKVSSAFMNDAASSKSTPALRTVLASARSGKPADEFVYAGFKPSPELMGKFPAKAAKDWHCGYEIYVREK